VTTPSTEVRLKGHDWPIVSKVDAAPGAGGPTAGVYWPYGPLSHSRARWVGCVCGWGFSHDAGVEVDNWRSSIEDDGGQHVGVEEQGHWFAGCQGRR